MNQSAVLDLGRKLSASVLALEALLASGEMATDLLVMRARKTARVQAADLQAAYAEPQPIKSYAPWNGIERT